eukprot:Gregarina_sp_Pseudo_9__2875@NODE_309_length_3204_cov_148_249289_g290_i0_p1_GENE_NODE_309_length_3204_cov_148_249289_g290_i0NODE_309_length_3204_cov_148_249289_g290_i0_p1_ORF_typecomplete_len710_score181_72Transketolase_N/PF00456_21/1_1e105Transketolase_N/PF00456_21/1_8e03Transket_pyr/PF02779_24/8_9e36Transketolase_C/PF02780_20/5_3e03Transketolase_C/PF02780_20/1_5e12E1_dh/PF00676_20/4_1e10DXP_synthase_N/PF13292_6/3_5e09DXP_synthase_N/PF13292_6/6_1e03TPP_enzyme_C/PF02775_21/1_4e07TPP_enzyme_C/PF02
MTDQALHANLKRRASSDGDQPPAKKQASSTAAHVEDLPTEYINVKNPKAALCINAIRCLAPALPQAAKSGHPGAPMGLAVVAYALWGHPLMKYSPKEPSWWNRDRFVLSNGHACALLYTMLHLTGYGVTLEELKNFRQVNSMTPGHPEANHTPGVEVTTGPLGQGIAQAVGIAIAAANIAAEFNKPDIQLFDSKTICIVGDGCLQEGISGEACSLAGHLKLKDLIAIYDDNHITIDGDTALSFTEDVEMRFRSYGWDVIHVNNGNIELDEITAAIQKARESKEKPTLVRVRTIIGYGSGQQGTAKVHGAPVGEPDIKALRAKCGFSDDLWDTNADVIKFFATKGDEGHTQCLHWHKLRDTYKAKYPAEFADLERRFGHQLPANWTECLPKYSASDKADATRNLSEKALNALRAKFPELIGGSADLMESNKTLIKVDEDFTASNRLGKRIRFGVREHAMVAICNGLFAFGGFRPFAATFLNFYTYAWGAARLSALSQFGVIMIATHDSIDLGEDGPTHQPIETAALMRATPNFNFIRPCDGNEVSGAYAAALENPSMPVCLALSRGNCPHIAGTSWEKVKLGAYVLVDFDAASKGKKIIIGASGTEVQEAVTACNLLKEQGYNVRVVSMPSWMLFELQPKQYQQEVFLAKGEATCVYIEALGNFGWSRYFDESLSCGMTTFGASGPAAKLKAHFKITAQALVDKIKAAGV